MICKKFIYILIVLLVSSLSVHAVQKATVKYEDNTIDYSVLNPDKIMAEADGYYAKYKETKENKYLSTAMGKYYILTKIYPVEIYPNVQLARTYDEKHLDRLAKSYFNRCININKYDPYLNYYFGDFYYKRSDYKRALRYFKIAYNNGYDQYYDVVIKIATIYEKFADLKNAKYYYEKAVSLNSKDAKAQEKAEQIKSLKYETSEYYTGN